jgi:agmatine deiminase
MIMKKLLLLSSTLLILTLTLNAQEAMDAWKLGHWLNAEEMLLKPSVSRSFVETLPPTAPVRNVAEFDRMQGALVRYPFGIPIALIKEMATECQVTTIVANTSQKNTVIQQYVSNGVDTSHCDFLIAPSDSYWTRDYGPWFASDSSNKIGIVDFPYNRPRPNDDEIPKKIADKLGIPWYGMRLISTGGDYMTDGLGISSSTDLVWVENPTLTHEQVAQKVKDYLGIDNYQVVPDPNTQSTIDHIDCWGKFLAPDKILIRQTLTSDPEYPTLEAAATYWASQTCSYGYNYRVFRVKTPQDQPYTNSVILNNKVLVPFMNSSWDDSAKAVYEAAMPGYEIHGFIGSPSTPWLSTDALHCRVMGIADIGLLYINHLPLSGNQPAQDNFFLSADLIPCSDSSIIDESVLIHFKVGSGPWLTKRMVKESGLHYTGYIPKQPAGSVIHYYLTAADKSGRNASCPLIGEADPFTFTAVYTDLTAIPDTLRFENYEDCMNGKYTAIQNFTTSAINLTAIENMGWFNPGPTGWLVETVLPPFPHSVDAGDSLRFKVIILIPTSMSYQGYWIDTLHFSTPTGEHQVIILLNDTLVFGALNDSRGNQNGLNVQVFPNPAKDHANFTFRLTKTEQVQLDLFDLRGRQLKSFGNKTFSSGVQKITWDLQSEENQRVSPGIYIYRLTTENESVTGRLIIH